VRVEYKNTFLDLFRYQIAHQLRMPVMQAFLLLFAAYVAFDQYGYSKDILASVFVAIIWYIAIWLLQIFFVLLVLVFTKRHTLTTWHAISIEDDGLHEESAFNRTVHFWHGGIVKIRRRAGCIAIYVTPFSAHIVPLRAFRDAKAADEFQREVQARRNAA